MDARPAAEAEAAEPPSQPAALASRNDDAPATPDSHFASLAAGLCGGIAIAIAAAQAQVPAPAPAAPAANAPATPASPSLAPLAWLAGCWRGAVNKREFREHWMPLRGGLIVGVEPHGDRGARRRASSTCGSSRGPTASTTSSRRPAQSETAFRLTRRDQRRRGRRIFTFANPGNDSRRRSSTAAAARAGCTRTVEGKVKGADTQVIYPMRRIDCESGENIEK